MNIWRRFGLGLVTFVCALSVSALIGLLTMQQTLFNRDVVKGWLRTSGVYAKAVDALAQSPQGNGGQIGGLLSAKDTSQALKQTFTPGYVQQQTETVLDKAYDWVDGKSDSITFSLPINEKRDELIANLAKVILPHAAALPLCNRLSAFSPDMVNCRPSIVSADEFARTLAAQGVGGSPFLSQPLTQDTIAQTTAGSTQSPPAAATTQIPTLAGWNRSLMVILPIIIALCLPATFLLAYDKLRAFRHLSRRIFWGSALTTGAGLLLLAFGPRLDVSMFSQAGAALGLFVDVLHVALPSIGGMLGLYGGIAAFISGSGWIACVVLIRRQHVLQRVQLLQPPATTPGTSDPAENKEPPKQQ